jgi:hypothetical protein
MLEPISEGRREIERQFADAFPEALGLAERLYQESKRRYPKDLFEPGELEELLCLETGFVLLVRQLLAARTSVEADASLRRVFDWVEQSVRVYGRDARLFVHITAGEIMESDKIEWVYSMTGEAIRQELVEAAESTTKLANSLELRAAAGESDGWDYSAHIEWCREQVAAYRRVASTDGGTP